MSPSATAETILAHLQSVEHERRRRAADPALAARASALREWQAQRLRETHAELLASPKTREAATFFLEQLYGAQDFVERDAQFARIVPAIVRLFSQEVRQTVAHLAELHALSERLDTAMALATRQEVLTRGVYQAAWQRVGDPAARERQIELVGLIGTALVRYTRHPSLGRALRLMRLPARAAGLHALQAFLEAGFATFGKLEQPSEFVQSVCGRERAEAAALFGE